jgi:hypothetical protein
VGHEPCQYYIVQHNEKINNVNMISGYAEGMKIMSYSLHFKMKVTFGHKLRYDIKIMFGEISLKLCRTSWNVAKKNVNVVVDDLRTKSNNNLHLFNN